MFKLVIFILLGISWISLCIEGTGTPALDAKAVVKNVVVEPIDTGHEAPGDEIKRAKRGKNEPTLALLLTYNGNNCHKKQKASTSKFETIHITNGGSAKNVPMGNVVGKKLLESIVHTTSSHTSSAGGSTTGGHKTPSENAIQHKYQELLDQLNDHPTNDKCGCCGLNMGSCKNRNQQFVQLADHLGQLQSIEKHASILESIESDSSSGSESEENHHHHHHHAEHNHHHHHHHPHHDHSGHDHDASDSSDSSDSTSSSHDDSDPVSVSISDESGDDDDDNSDESFDISESDSDEHELGPIEHSLFPDSHHNDNYHFELHPHEPQTIHTIIPKPVKLRPKYQAAKPHTSDTVIVSKSQKQQQPRILAGPHIKLKSKHYPHHSHLKPLYIETGSIYSDSLGSDESHSHSAYSDEESLELPIETDDHGHRYKSGKYKKREAN